MSNIFRLPKIICLAFIAFGLYFLTTNLIRQSTWEKTTGIVLEVKERKKNKNQFYPLVEIEMETGKKVQVAIKQSSNRFYYKKGENIPIIYPKHNFKKAKINSTGWAYGFPLFFVVLGIIGFLIPSHLWHRS